MKTIDAIYTEAFAPTIRQEAGITPAFIEALIKRSVSAEEILQECGRIRFQRAIQDAINLYEEMSAGRTQKETA